MTAPDQVPSAPSPPSTASASASTDSALLTDLATRSAAAALAANTAAQDLLRSIGVTDPATWAAFRLGAGGDALAAGLDPAAWARCRALGLRKQGQGFVLAAAGINIPTAHPAEPGRVIGFVRIAPAQAKHAFATAPAGIACTADIGAQDRIVLADSPALAMRLHKHGIRGAALVEDPSVLLPLLPWLAGRRVIVASFKRQGLDALRAALGPLAATATALQLQPDLAVSAAEALAVLGLDRARLRPAKPSPVVDARTLHDLLAYAQGRVATAEGMAALDVFGANQPELVAVYRLGFIPADYRGALDPATRRMLGGLRAGNSLVLPALDADGEVVDLHLRYAGADSHRTTNLHPEPRGLIGPAVATAYDEVIATPSVWSLCRLHRQGHRNVLFLRGADDVRHNADRLRAAGVRAVRVLTEPRYRTADMVEAFRVAGFAVTAWADKVAAVEVNAASVEALNVTTEPAAPAPAEPAPAALRFPGLPAAPEAAPAPAAAPAAQPTTTIALTIPPLTLVEHDQKTALATFTAGTATFTAEVPFDGASRMEVCIRHGGRVHRDRFDVAVEAQRRRFASSAALRTAVPAETIEPHLIALLDAVRGLVAAQEAGRAPAVASVSPADRAAAMSMLTAPDLLDRIRADLVSLGWVGEDEGKTLLYLAAISRKLPDPLWAALMASPGAGKSHGMDLIAEMTPPEELIQVSRLTDSALYYSDAGGLSHKLLVIDEADALTPDVITALRVLKTRGALSLSRATHHGPRGHVTTAFIEARGPVSVLTSTAGALDAQLLSRCVEVPVDESPAQTARILAAQRRLSTGPCGADGGKRAAVIALHRNMGRLLRAAPVVIPYAERIEFPATSVRHRREQQRFLGLIEASALLHQHQRMTDQGAIVADTRDFEVAARLTAGQVAAAHAGLGHHARALLALLAEHRLTSATMDDLARICPEGTRHAFRTGLEELVALDYVTATGGGHGRVRTYRLTTITATTAGPVPGVRLREVGELATVGETGSGGRNLSVSAG